MSDATGSWVGSNGFRMMPSDELQHAPCTAVVSPGAGGQEVLLTYTWTHPSDGPQDGVLLVGSAGEGDGVAAAWGDSWHQHPGLMTLHGTSAEERIELAGEYGGEWGWLIALHLGDPLRMIMSNVVPDSYGTSEAPAGPYEVMVAELQRAAPR